MFSIGEDKEQDIVHVRNSGDNVYYNVLISNSSRDRFGNPSQLPVPARFFESRTTPIFDGKPSDWTLSVVRFDVPSQLIPIQIVPTYVVQVGTTSYVVGMKYRNIFETKSVLWTPEDKTAPVPPPTVTPTDRFRNYSAYYSLYSYNHMMGLLNDAILRCYNSMVTKGMPPSAPPYMTYDATTKLFTLTAPAAFLNDAPDPIEFYFNTDLMKNFLGSLPAYKRNEGTGFDYQLQITDNYNNSVVLPSPYGLSYNMIQEVQALDLWYSFGSLVMLTASLPVVNEWTAETPVQGAPFAGILTDFQVQYNAGTDLRNFIQYVPTAEYRRITMTSDSPIENVDIQIFWRTKDSNILIPLLIPFFNQVNIKLLFERK